MTESAAALGMPQDCHRKGSVLFDEQGDAEHLYVNCIMAAPRPGASCPTSCHSSNAWALETRALDGKLQNSHFVFRVYSFRLPTPQP